MTSVDHAPWWRTALQVVMLAVYLVGLFGALIGAVVATGDYGALVDPGLDRLGDPKDSMPSNPLLLWGVGIPTAIVIYVWYLPVFGLPLALIRPRSVRWALIWVALTALALSPYGADLHNWLLD